MGMLITSGKTLLFENGVFTPKVCDIFIEGDTIVAVGERPEGFVAEKTINACGKLVIPGLINCHTHAYMTVFRNIADDLPFQDWLMGNIMPLEDKTTADDAYWGAQLACAEMIRSGTTCFADMHMFEGTSVRAAAESGMRAVIARGLSGGENDKDGGARRLREAFSEIDYAKTLSHNDRISFLLGPHAIYTCDGDYIKEIVALARERDMGLHIHLSESRFEANTCYNEHGCSPVERLLWLGLFTRPTIAAHCVYLSKDDMAILSALKVTAVTNPISNLKLGNGFAHITDLMKAKVNIALGTDGAASNNALNLFREMGVLTLIHKGVLEDAAAVSANDALTFATVNGAKALGLNTGEIAVGKKADLAIIDLDAPHMNPMNNPVSALCYSANGSEVETVIIDGNIVMENRRLLTLDEERIRFETNRIVKKFRQEA